MRNSLRIQLEGGLGNQLFQLAAVLHYSNLRKSDYLLIQAEKFDSKYFHRNALEALTGINLVRRRFFFLGRLGTSLWRLDRLFLRRLAKYQRIRKIFLQQDSQTPIDIPPYANEIRGYFQGKEFAAEFRELITRVLLEEKGEVLPNLIPKEFRDGCISVHIRRGDYLKLKSKYGELGTRYYSPAIQKVTNALNCKKVLIFSDDLEFAQNFMKSPEYADLDLFFIPAELNPYENLLLMMDCKGHVISNSTFSWWGAFLAKSTKLVVAPSEWSKDGSIEPILNLSTWNTLNPHFE